MSAGGDETVVKHTYVTEQILIFFLIWDYDINFDSSICPRVNSSSSLLSTFLHFHFHLPCRKTRISSTHIKPPQSLPFPSEAIHLPHRPRHAPMPPLETLHSFFNE